MLFFTKIKLPSLITKCRSNYRSNANLARFKSLIPASYQAYRVRTWSRLKRIAAKFYSRLFEIYHMNAKNTMNRFGDKTISEFLVYRQIVAFMWSVDPGLKIS